MTPKPEGGNQEAGWTPRERPQAGERTFRSPRALAAGERSFSPLQAEVGAAVERQLLLADGLADAEEVPRPAGTKRGGWLIAATIFAVAAALGGVTFVRVERIWQEKVSQLEGQIGSLSLESAQRIEVLRKEGADKDRVIAERKSENQSLAALMDKTLVELKASLGDLRRERERSQTLEAEYRKAVESRRSFLGEMLSAWVPRWLAGR